MARPSWQALDLRSGPANRRQVFLPLDRGVYLDRSRLEVPRGGLVDCKNVRIERGTVTNENCGWTKFPFNAATQLNLEARAVLLVGTHVSRLGARSTVFGTDRDLYQFFHNTGDVQYRNPRIETGTVTIVGTAATFSIDIQAAGAKAGDYLHRSNAGQTGTPVSVAPITDWTRFVSVSGFGAVLASAPGDVAGVAYTIRRVFTGGMTGIWDVEMFPDAPGALDLLFGTNGVDDIWKWDGAATQVTLLSGLGIKCRTLTRASNIMLYGYLIEGGVVKPSEVRTSDIAAPENVTTGAAAEFNVGRGNAPIVAVRRLHESVVVYKGGDEIGSVHVMEFVGPPLQWVQRTVADNRGPRSMRAIAQFPNYHEFFSHDQAYRFDGSTQPTPLAPHALRAAAQAFDASRPEQAIAHVSEEYGEVFWVYPSATDMIPSGLAEAVPQNAVTTHYVEEERISRGRFVAREAPATLREVPNVTAIGAVYRETALRFSDLPQAFSISQFPFNDRFFSGVYPQVVFGDAQGNLWVGNLGSSKGGASMESTARLMRLAGDGGAGARTGIVKRVYPQLATKEAATYEVEVLVYGSDYGERAATQLHSKGVSPRNDKSIGPSHTIPNVHARFFEVALRTSGIDSAWRASGVFVDVEVAGERG